MSIKKLEKKISLTGSSLVLKLDGINTNVPQFLKKDGKNDISATCETERLMINTLKGIIPAVIIKPVNYWVCGDVGARQLEKTLKCAKENDMYIIIDWALPLGEANMLSRFLKEDSACFSLCGDFDALQEIIFSVNKNSGLVFVHLDKNCNIDKLNQLVLQAAPLSGYGNLGIYITDIESNKDIRKMLPQGFFLCPWDEKPAKLKPYFGDDGGGIAFCISLCEGDMLTLSKQEFKTVLLDKTEKYRIKVRKMQKKIMNNSLLI